MDIMMLGLPNTLPLATSILLLVAILVTTPLFLHIISPSSTLPLINTKRPFEIRYFNARKRFITDAYNLINTGFAKASIFRIGTEIGYQFLLDPKYANEIRSHQDLNFAKAVGEAFHDHIPGFEPFGGASLDEQIFQDAVRIKLTQSLGGITEPLSSEMAVALKARWTDDTEWHNITLKSSILAIVAQLSSKVFLGDQICRNPNWLRITVDYTVDSFLAAEALRLWPKPVRPIVAPFLKPCQKIRAELQEARDIIAPVLEQRRIAKETAIKAGKTPERYPDAIQWMEECAKGRPYDPVVAQMAMSLAAIHTTSDMLTQVLYDISGREDLIHALRDEITTVVSEEGWKKSTLYKLKLMDSTLKESQRLKPIGITSMRRKASSNITLSDGTLIPKNSLTLVSNKRMWDPTIYPNPKTFDPYRFLKLREKPGHETSAQLVAPSPEHMGFGLGMHACPGRFFAANEVKIALCHILLKYDFRVFGEVQVRRNGVSLGADPRGVLAVRRREEEIEL